MAAWIRRIDFSCPHAYNDKLDYLLRNDGNIHTRSTPWTCWIVHVHFDKRTVFAVQKAWSYLNGDKDKVTNQGNLQSRTCLKIPEKSERKC